MAGYSDVGDQQRQNLLTKPLESGETAASHLMDYKRAAMWQRAGAFV